MYTNIVGLLEEKNVAKLIHNKKCNFVMRKKMVREKFSIIIFEKQKFFVYCLTCNKLHFTRNNSII